MKFDFIFVMQMKNRRSEWLWIKEKFPIKNQDNNGSEEIPIFFCEIFVKKFLRFSPLIIIPRRPKPIPHEDFRSDFDEFTTIDLPTELERKLVLKACELI